MLSACGSIFLGGGQSSSRIRKSSGFLFWSVWKSYTKVRKVSGNERSAVVLEWIELMQPVWLSMAKVIPDIFLCLTKVHTLPKCPELYSGGNAALITIKQMVHPNRGLHNNTPICYIYADSERKYQDVRLRLHELNPFEHNIWSFISGNFPDFCVRFPHRSE